MEFDVFTVLMITIGVVVIGFIASKLIDLYGETERIEDRIDFVLENEHDHRITSRLDKDDSFINRLLSFDFELMKMIADRTKELTKHNQLQFERAGWSPRNAPIIVLGIRLIFVLSSIIISVILLTFKDTILTKNDFINYALVIILIAYSFKAYDTMIDIIISRRFRRMQKTLPFTVDLMSICARAGYSLDRSFEIIAEEVANYNMDLCVEFMRVSIELSLIPDRKEALRNFAHRIDVPLIKILVTGLIQSEEQGASMGQTLTHLSQDFTKQKIAEIDEQASKIPTKILLPMALFCLPGFLLFLMGPVVANIMRSSFMK